MMKRSSRLFFRQSLAIEWKSLPKRRLRLYVCMTPIILLHSDTNFATLKMKWGFGRNSVILYRKISILGQWVRISIIVRVRIVMDFPVISFISFLCDDFLHSTCMNFTFYTVTKYWIHRHQRSRGTNRRFRTLRQIKSDLLSLLFFRYWIANQY